jgi:hypothetical protein
VAVLFNAAATFTVLSISAVNVAVLLNAAAPVSRLLKLSSNQLPLGLSFQFISNCVNALPNEHELAKKLSFLIENPEIISKISINARNFIEKEHHYQMIATKYLTCWEGKL